MGPIAEGAEHEELEHEDTDEDAEDPNEAAPLPRSPSASSCSSLSELSAVWGSSVSCASTDLPSDDEQDSDSWSFVLQKKKASKASPPPSSRAHGPGKGRSAAKYADIFGAM
uniref:Uncharacterized protein n=1 Tax=Zooxanthella nutricula TaxID=1333877 RepID=A0A7S2Q5C6_9DINO